jgi:hypothetical protein
MKFAEIGPSQTWQLLTGNHLFSAQKEGILDDEQHLAEMVSLLGPPPKSFLDRGKRCSIYWDSEGKNPFNALSRGIYDYFLKFHQAL